MTFDFLGWGRSSKPSHYSYTFAGQEEDLNAVIQGLHLGRVVLVAHDASVPAVLNWALDHPGHDRFDHPLERLLRSSRCEPGRRLLPTIFALGQWPITSPLGPLPPGTAYGLNSLMNGLSNDPRLLDDLLTWQESTFDGNRINRAEVHRLCSPSSSSPNPAHSGPLRSFAGNHHLRRSAATTLPASQVSSPSPCLFTSSGAPRIPISVSSVADALHQEIPDSTLTVFPNAHHNLMLDDPTQFAAAIRSAATG